MKRRARSRLALAPRHVLASVGLRKFSTRKEDTLRKLRQQVGAWLWVQLLMRARSHAYSFDQHRSPKRAAVGRSFRLRGPSAAARRCARRSLAALRWHSTSCTHALQRPQFQPAASCRPAHEAQGLARLHCSQAATNKPLPGDFALPAASTRPPGYGRHQPGSVAAPSHGGRRRGLRRVSPPLRRPAAAVRQPRAAAPPLLPARMQPVLRLRAPLAVSALAGVAPAAPRRLIALGLGYWVLTPSPAEQEGQTRRRRRCRAAAGSSTCRVWTPSGDGGGGAAARGATPRWRRLRLQRRLHAGRQAVQLPRRPVEQRRQRLACTSERKYASGGVLGLCHAQLWMSLWVIDRQARSHSVSRLHSRDSKLTCPDQQKTRSGARM